MGITVIRQGVFSTIQDGGRTGFARWGISPGGPMDIYASRIATALVGNSFNDPVVEMHFPAGELAFSEPALISITGADFSPMVDGVAIPLWKPVLVPRDCMLRCGKKVKGERSYLAVRGGFVTTQWLGSSATNVKIGAGGNAGHILLPGDVIPFRHRLPANPASGKPVVFPWSANPSRVYENSREIRFIEGAEWGWLTEDSQQKLMSTALTIRATSDRMGFYLGELPLEYRVRDELVSTAVTFGTIQALPQGGIVVLMADHQTTGGYPRIGHVITNDLPKLAQLSPGTSISLKKISHHDAEKMVISLEHQLRTIQQSCHHHLQNYDAKY